MYNARIPGVLQRIAFIHLVIGTIHMFFAKKEYNTRVGQVYEYSASEKC